MPHDDEKQVELIKRQPIAGKKYYECFADIDHHNK